MTDSRTSNTLSSLLSEYLRAIGGSQDGLTFKIIMSFIQWTEDVARERRTHEPRDSHICGPNAMCDMDCAERADISDQLYALLVRRGYAQHEAQQIAHGPSAQPPEPSRSVVLSGYELQAALEFLAPDLQPEQLESEVSIQYGTNGHSGAGYYCCMTEYPEEGSILLGAPPASHPTKECEHG